VSATSHNDAALAAQVAGGDENAAEAFDSRFRPYLLRFLQTRIPFEDQEDLVQEVLFAALQQLRSDGFRGESVLGTWLIGILKHKIADYRAQATRVHAFPARVTSGSDAAPPLIFPRHYWSPDAAIDVERLIDALPKFHRSVLLLNLREGWTTEEIATAMRKSPGTTGRVLWEAKRMLQRNHPELKKIGGSNDQ
jgi:RNA polymerase sigma factor (sigma-70 family)